MDHKEKCKFMKRVRKQIADTIGVELHQTECTYQGECKGTCPKCAQEEKILNRALLGGTAVAVGMSLSACSLPPQTQLAGEAMLYTEEMIEGEMSYSPGVSGQETEKMTVFAPELLKNRETDETSETNETPEWMKEILTENESGVDLEIVGEVVGICTDDSCLTQVTEETP